MKVNFDLSYCQLRSIVRNFKLGRGRSSSLLEILNIEKIKIFRYYIVHIDLNDVPSQLLYSNHEYMNIVYTELKIPHKLNLYLFVRQIYIKFTQKYIPTNMKIQSFSSMDTVNSILYVARDLLSLYSGEQTFLNSQGLVSVSYI